MSKISEKDQQYCVAAEDRADGKRKAITQGMKYEAAFDTKEIYNKSSKMKKDYKYFHVSKFPYKTHSNK